MWQTIYQQQWNRPRNGQCVHNNSKMKMSVSFCIKLFDGHDTQLFVHQGALVYDIKYNRLKLDDTSISKAAGSIRQKFAVVRYDILYMWDMMLYVRYDGASRRGGVTVSWNDAICILSTQHRDHRWWRQTTSSRRPAAGPVAAEAGVATRRLMDHGIGMRWDEDGTVYCRLIYVVWTCCGGGR